MTSTARWTCSYVTRSLCSLTSHVWRTWLVVIRFDTCVWVVSIVQEPHWASADEIKAFHASEYIDFLQRVNPVNQKDLSLDLQKCMLGYFLLSWSSLYATDTALSLSLSLSRIRYAPVNLGEITDCPVFDGVFNFCQIYSGGSLGALQTHLLPQSPVSSETHGRAHSDTHYVSSCVCVCNRRCCAAEPRPV